MPLAALGDALAFYGIILLVIVLGSAQFIGEYIMAAGSIGFHEWAKQLAIWLAISTLLPFTAYYGTAAFTRIADPDEYSRVQNRLTEQLSSAKDDAEKNRLRAEIDRLSKEHTDQDRIFAKRLLYVAYPIGLAALVIGLFTPVQPVGAGLMFGGLATLTTGCYEGFEYLGPWGRLCSLIVLLIIIIWISLRRYRIPRPQPDTAPHGQAAQRAIVS